MTLPTPYPVARYRFDCKVETPIRLPEYAGSTLRGAFGHALRRAACVTREKDCKACSLYRACAYPAIFAPPPPAEHSLQRFSDIPVPFVVEPPEWGERRYEPGETLVFHFVLMGRVLGQMPLIVHAWQRALAQGIGKGEGTATLTRVSHLHEADEQTVYDAAGGQILAHPAAIDIDPSLPEAGVIRLRLTTPLRLQHNGRPIRPEHLRARDLLVQLMRRVALISEFHVGQRLQLDYGALAERAGGIRDDKALTWRDWTRYSNRQKQEMTLGGVVGEWGLAGEMSDFVPMLRLGQWLHAGKNASFGLGQYHLET